MWFLIKGSFWFGLVLVLLSVFSTEGSDKLADGPQLQLSDAFLAASGAYDYLTGMCSERPEVCAKGTETLTALGYRAREGARVAYELLDSQFTDEQTTTARLAEPANGTAPAMPSLASPSVQEKVREAKAALNQPMPYRPPVDDESESVVTGAIPLPTPKPAI
ncbi:DUF5330 domain-containing protein [Rhizobium bangladeshense]|uniref:DUF5330 domain-containing protein n=1 Tax=Rhizobium bangladeshense TaxID=1138189 RepID=A0ABS7LLY0_9HYPH|nr:DUF5330 domain-containing protein [Rhizobium bangladeshense]MBX4869490.1 DUF5330 domain-containing protein [Rhizobium bangladeshense]MBX4874886.1 DUF5330 domain-containing protein [Rhizobium bangladeshense]MBX4885073.1 DUF5330 domain-containing protein [Rhizobium bangladeshense]MBX4897245.1 DUF5330 domain-containing protein [Rhizobium bangladeshense]MBX4902655.1 DUF5330 domain-containing protein [Rhizobium bangladeshense]